jgi:hypothetical protein
VPHTFEGDRVGLGLPSHCIVTVLGELAPLVGLELERKIIYLLA